MAYNANIITRSQLCASDARECKERSVNILMSLLLMHLLSERIARFIACRYDGGLGLCYPDVYRYIARGLVQTWRVYGCRGWLVNLDNVEDIRFHLRTSVMHT